MSKVANKMKITCARRFGLAVFIIAVVATVALVEADSAAGAAAGGGALFVGLVIFFVQGGLGKKIPR